MIKLTMNSPDGHKVVGLGLSAENIKRLQADDPILFNGAEVGLPGIHFVIMAGDTELDLSDQLHKHFTIDKEIHHDDPGR